VDVIWRILGLTAPNTEEPTHPGEHGPF
jgi:hypothetical protein